MSNYTKITDFAAKDAMAITNANKVISGTTINNEFTAIATAVNTKVEKNAGTHTGTTTMAVISGASSITSSVFQGAIVGSGAGLTTSLPAALVRTAVEAATNSNVFTDADHTKLNGNAVVEGHVRAGNTQLMSGTPLSNSTLNTAATATYIVTSNSAEDAWVTVGPTGSGATKIWTALNQLPANSTVLLASAFIAVTTQSTSQSGQVRLSVASGDAPTAPDVATTQIASVQFDPASTIEINQQVMIPLNSARIFKVYWRDIANVSPTSITLKYRGFMLDSA